MRKTRFLALVLAGIMLLSAALPVQAAGGLQIPGDRPDGVTRVNEYKPGTDGYFAYLPIRYFEDPWHTAESEMLKGDLPVLIWERKIFVSAALLAEASGLIAEESGDKIQFSWGERKLVVTLDQTGASFRLGTCREGQTPYLQTRLTLSAAPFRRAGGTAFVPLTDICSIMGVDLYADSEEESPRYVLNPPREDVYDILASFRDDTLRESYMFMYEVDENALKDAEVSSRAVMTLNGMLNGETDKYLYTVLMVMCSMEYITQYIPTKYIWNKVDPGRDPERMDIDKEFWDLIIAGDMIRALWFASEKEMVETAQKTADVMSSELDILLYDDVVKNFILEEGHDHFELLIDQLKRTNTNNQAWISARTYAKYESMLESYETQSKALGPKLDSMSSGLSEASDILSGVSIGLTAFNDLQAYAGRDKVMDDALLRFMSYGGYNYLSTGAVTRMKAEYIGYTALPTMYAFAKAVWENASEEAFNEALDPAFLITTGFKIATAIDPVYQKTLDSMEAYQTSLLSIAMQHEAHDDAYRGILLNDKNIHASLRGEALEKEILQAYLYFKSCATTRELVQKAFEYQDAMLDDLYQKLTLLELTYGKEENERPAPYTERFKDSLSSLDKLMIEHSVIPLYQSVNGAVVTFGDEKPVPNAICKVTEHGVQRVDFQADGEGEYHEIYIPVFWPEAGITTFDPNFELKLFFYSEEEGMEGDDTKLVGFEPKGDEQVSDAHLLLKGSMEAFVTDKNTGEAIEGASYELELLNPEIYEGIDLVQKTFQGKADASGHILQKDMAPGKYRAKFSAKDYESKELEIEIKSGEVTELSVELEKRMWLLVAKDEKDIATGFWSQYLEYAYDKKGRLIEVTGSDMDYQACVYDAEGRLIKEIGGTSGGYGTWTAKDYSYDAEGRIIQIDYSALTLYSARSMSDWVKASASGANGKESLRYEEGQLIERTRYLPDGKLSYRITYEYDAEGRLLKEITTDEKGSQTYLTTYQYNEKGLLVQKDEEGTRGVTILYEYDEEDRLSQEKNLYTGYRNTYAYDEHGNLSVEKVFDYAGKQAWQYEYFYKLFPFEEE